MRQHIPRGWRSIGKLRTALDLESEWEWDQLTWEWDPSREEAANLAKHGSVWKLKHTSEEAQPSSVRHPHHHVCDAT